jgi:TPP-dependent pyruvate/acetoin dehydrogenase alpha subunit
MTDETDRFFAELYGKESGIVRGKGGSMHLASPEHGLVATTAIVGGTIAPAVGAAFANKYLDNGRVVASFFGDGAMEEGVFSEALNAACLFRLPVLFVCEDNGLAVDVTSRQRQGFRSIAALAGAYECDFFEASTIDPEDILGLAEAALKSILTQGRPAFLHLRYYRFLQHVGVNPYSGGGRWEVNGACDGPPDKDEWMLTDPVKTQRMKLLALGLLEADVVAIERGIEAEIRSSVEKAKSAPLPDESEILGSVLAK